MISTLALSPSKKVLYASVCLLCVSSAMSSRHLPLTEVKLHPDLSLAPFHTSVLPLTFSCEWLLHTQMKSAESWDSFLSFPFFPIIPPSSTHFLAEFQLFCLKSVWENQKPLPTSRATILVPATISHCQVNSNRLLSNTLLLHEPSSNSSAPVMFFIVDGKSSLSP